MKLNQWSLAMLALIVSSISACGGGGGGAPSTPTTTPSPPVQTSQYVPVVSSVAAANYSSIAATAAFNKLNAERQRCGFGLLAQNTNLDTAATNHAAYIKKGEENGLSATTYSHTEDPSQPLFTGATPLARAINAGYLHFSFESLSKQAQPRFTNGPFVTEQASDLVIRLLTAPYHAQSMLTQSIDAGVGVATTTPDVNGFVDDILVMDFGQGSRANILGQSVDKNVLVAYPCDGTTQVPYGFVGESPAPTANVAAHISAGPGIYVMNSVGQQLTVGTWTIRETASATPLSSTIITSATDTNRLIGANFAVLLPDAPLKGKTNYTVSFTGLIDSTPTSKTWSFTTSGYYLTGGAWCDMNNSLVCPNTAWPNRN
jgi:uncharacterized protein YkwD